MHRKCEVPGSDGDGRRSVSSDNSDCHRKCFFLKWAKILRGGHFCVLERPKRKSKGRRVRTRAVRNDMATNTSSYDRPE